MDHLLLHRAKPNNVVVGDALLSFLYYVSEPRLSLEHSLELDEFFDW